MEEKKIEQKLASDVAKRGGMCPKLSCPGMDGMPDRMILFPGGRIAFVEVKAPGKKLRPIQEKRRRDLQHFGHRVYVLDDINRIGEILDEILTS